MTEMLYWPNKAKDLESKAKECIICFQAGKNLHSVIPQNEKNKLPVTERPLELLQIDFFGPIIDEKGKKKPNIGECRQPFKMGVDQTD